MAVSFLLDSTSGRKLGINYMSLKELLNKV
jgi:hypothetical protein